MNKNNATLPSNGKKCKNAIDARILTSYHISDSI